MEDRSRGWLFRKRNVLGAALVAGVVVGMYLPDFWNGFGGGSTIGVGVGDSTAGTGGIATDSDSTLAVTPDVKPKPSEETQLDPTLVPPVIKVLIDEKSFFIRSAEGDKEVTIPEIIALVQAATGDADGIRVRIYQKGTSRPSAENALSDAFSAAKISETTIVWIPTIVK
jgi:hypothetical protein